MNSVFVSLIELVFLSIPQLVCVRCRVLGELKNWHILCFKLFIVESYRKSASMPLWSKGKSVLMTPDPYHTPGWVTEVFLEEFTHVNLLDSSPFVLSRQCLDFSILISWCFGLEAIVRKWIWLVGKMFKSLIHFHKKNFEISKAQLN